MIKIQKPSTKVIISICVIILFFGIAQYFTRQIITVYFIQSRLAGQSGMDLVPIEKTIKSRVYNPSDINKYESDTYKFNLPFTIISQEERSNIVKLHFDQSKSMIVYNHYPEDDYETVNYKSLFSEAGVSLSLIEKYYGAQSTKDDYNLSKVIYSQTPGQYNIFTPRKKLVIGTMFLTYKATILIIPKGQSSSNAIFALSSDRIRGYQFGRAGDNRSVYLNLDNGNGRAHSLVFRNFTQEEIDYVLGSLTINSNK